MKYSVYFEVKKLDKYEYNLKIDQMKSLYAEENYEAAAEIADTINWSKIKNVNALVRAGEVYEKVGRYEESKEILLTAYDRSPIGRMIIFRLAEVAVKMNDFDAANEYYNEFPNLSKSLVNGLDESNLVIKVRINSLYGDNQIKYQFDSYFIITVNKNKKQKILVRLY